MTRPIRAAARQEPRPGDERGGKWVHSGGRCGPGRVALWVRTSAPDTKVSGSIPGQGTYNNQPMDSSISGITNLPLHFLSLSLKSIIMKRGLIID